MMHDDVNKAEQAASQLIRSAPVLNGYAVDEYAISEAVANSGFKPATASIITKFLFDQALNSRTSRFETYSNELGQRFLREPLTKQQHNQLFALLCERIIEFVSKNARVTAFYIAQRLNQFKRIEVLRTIDKMKADGQLIHLNDDTLVIAKHPTANKQELVTVEKQYRSKINDAATSLLNIPLSPGQLKQLKTFALQRELPLEVAASYLLSRMITYVEVCNECINDQPTTTATSTNKTPVLV